MWGVVCIEMFTLKIQCSQGAGFFSLASIVANLFFSTFSNMIIFNHRYCRALLSCLQFSAQLELLLFVADEDFFRRVGGRSTFKLGPHVENSEIYNCFFSPLKQFWLQLLLYNHLQHSASSFPTCLILKRK